MNVGDYGGYEKHDCPTIILRGKPDVQNPYIGFNIHTVALIEMLDAKFISFARHQTRGIYLAFHQSKSKIPAYKISVDKRENSKRRYSSVSGTKLVEYFGMNAGVYEILIDLEEDHDGIIWYPIRQLE